MSIQLTQIKYIKYNEGFKTKLLKSISVILDEVDAHNKNLNLKLMWEWRNEGLPSKKFFNLFSNL